MSDRQITYGADATDATYRSGDADATGGGNFVVAEDLDGATVLLEWDQTNGEWVSRGPVELSGNDITGVGALTANSVDTEESNITNLGAVAELSSSQTISGDSSETQLQFDSVVFDDEDEFDTANHKFVAADNGTYYVSIYLEYKNIPDGTRLQARIKQNGSLQERSIQTSGASDNMGISATATLRLSAGDEVAAYTSQNSGSNIDVEGSFEPATRFQIIKFG